MNKAARTAYYYRYSRTQTKAENSMYTALMAWLDAVGTHVVSTFVSEGADAVTALTGEIKPADLEKVFFESYGVSAGMFRAFLLKNFEKPVEKRGILGDAAINIGFFSQRFQNIVTEFAAQMAAERVSKICDTLREMLTKTITNAVANNADKQKVAREIKRNWKEVSRNRARLIARTETTTISGFAQMQTANEFTIELDKVWISARDSRTRTDHRSADGQRVAKDEDFTIGGAKMAQPGDPKGGAENCCNCRCTVAFVPKRNFGPLR